MEGTRLINIYNTSELQRSGKRKGEWCDDCQFFFYDWKTIISLTCPSSFAFLFMLFSKISYEYRASSSIELGNRR